jgi:hypothetical protein
MTSSSKTDEALAQAEEAYADDPERAEMLRTVRRFKASWIELAEGLTRARASGSWKRWGYETFEDYAKRELHLRQETVDKLTGSFQFLRKRAPEMLDRDAIRTPMPSYQAIDFLRRAESESDAPKDMVDAIRHKILEEGAPFAQVSKEFKDKVFPLAPAEKRSKDAQAIKNVAGRLREILKSTRAVPKQLATDVTAALDELLLAVSPQDEAAA